MLRARKFLLESKRVTKETNAQVIRLKYGIENKLAELDGMHADLSNAHNRKAKAKKEPPDVLANQESRLKKARMNLDLLKQILLQQNQLTRDEESRPSEMTDFHDIIFKTKAANKVIEE